MSHAHDVLRAAARHALQGQQSVVENLDEEGDPALVALLVEVSGLYNRIAHRIYTVLREIEADANDDVELQ